MNYTLIDYFNGFALLRNRNHKLTANDISVFYTILNEFNVARFPEEMELSTRILQDLAGIASVATVHRAKNVLKNIGAIDFTTKNGVTVYKLKDEHFANRRLNNRKTKSERRANTAAEVYPLLSVPVEDTDRQTESETAHAKAKGEDLDEKKNGGGNARRREFAIDARAKIA